jgi:hypothetical protein
MKIMAVNSSSICADAAVNIPFLLLLQTSSFESLVYGPSTFCFSG